MKRPYSRLRLFRVMLRAPRQRDVGNIVFRRGGEMFGVCRSLSIEYMRYVAVARRAVTCGAVARTGKVDNIDVTAPV